MRLTRRSALVGAAAATATPLRAQTASSPAEPGRPAEAGMEDVLPAGVNLTTRVVAPVHLNNAGPYQFVVDTGAGRTSLAAEIAESLGLEAGPIVRVHGLVGAAPAPTVLLPELRLARRRARNLTLPVFPRQRLGADGLLGLDLLGSYRLTFDMARRRVSLARQRFGVEHRMTASRFPNRNVLDGRRRFGPLIVTDVMAEGIPVSAFVDSGSQYSVGNLALMNSVAVRRPAFRERVTRVPLYGVTGQTRMTELAHVAELRVGDERLRNVPVFFADVHAFEIWELLEQPALILGADVMRLFGRVVLDFPANQIVVGRPGF